MVYAAKMDVHKLNSIPVHIIVELIGDRPWFCTNEIWNGLGNKQTLED